MGQLADKAVFNHRSWYSCSASVLCAFAGEAGLSESEARREAEPFAGGRMGKCGAVLAAERVIELRYGEQRAAGLIERLEASFIGMNRSVYCKELRGLRLRPCRGCVQDSAQLLEQLLAEQG